MRVVHISGSDCSGGAARSAFRLHLGLLAAGIDSSMLVLRKRSPLPSTHAVADPRGFRGRLWGLAEFEQIHRNRTALTNSHFSIGALGVDVAEHPLVAAADVINLHWVADFQSPRTLARLQRTGRPLVWTLHDQRAFTGGCHYSAGCTGYEGDCARCPQIAENPHDFPAVVLADQMALIDARRITVVSPSQWLAGCARRSRLFSAARVEVIPYGLETDVFRAQRRAEARADLGLQPEGCHILFGAENSAETRKGMRELYAALSACARDAGFARRLRSGELRILSFGPLPDESFAREFAVHSFGYVDSDEKMARIYAAANLFVQPSLEDNLPNTILEAMSCGTAVAAFAIGGVPDLVTDGVTGQLARRTDSAGLAEAILALAADPRQLDELGERARALIETGFTLSRQAQDYLRLYTALYSAPPVPPVLSASEPRAEALFTPLLLRSLPAVAGRLPAKIKRLFRHR